MDGRHAERGFEHRAAHLEFPPCRLVGRLAEHDVIDRMRPDGHQRIGRHLADLRPGHAQLLAMGRHVDAVPAGEVAHEGEDLLLGRLCAQPPVERIVDFLLGAGARALDAALLSVHQQHDAVVARDHLFERDPPKLTEPIRKAGRHVDGKRHLRRLEDRIGKFLVVAVAVVERDAREAAAKIPFEHAAIHLVERDEVDPRAAQMPHHPFEKARRDLEQAIGLEPVAARRSHVVKHQDRADAADERPHQHMRAAEVEYFQSGADDRVSDAHGECPAVPRSPKETTADALNATADSPVSKPAR